MLHPGDCFFMREFGDGARNLNNVVSAPGEFLGKREPDFFDSAAHDGRHGQKRAENDRDSHFAVRGGVKIDNNESIARSI